MTVEQEMDIIIRETSKKYKIPIDQILSRSRAIEKVLARQIAHSVSYYLLNGHEFEDLAEGKDARFGRNASKKKIGLHIGGRDHSTVINSIRSIADQVFCERLKYNRLKKGPLEFSLIELWSECSLMLNLDAHITPPDMDNHTAIVEKSKQSVDGLCLQIKNPEYILKNTALTIEI